MDSLFKKVKKERDLMVKTKIESIRQTIITILADDPTFSNINNECFTAYRYLLDVLKIINKKQYEQYIKATYSEMFTLLGEIKEKELYILEPGLNIDVLLRYDLTYPIKLPCETHNTKINDNPISEIKIDVWTTYGIQLHSGITDVYGHFQPFVVTALSADINEKVNLSKTGEDIIDQDEYTALLKAKKYIEENYPKRTMMGFK